MRRLALLLIVLLALAAGWLLAGGWLLTGMGRWLDVGGEPLKTEHVLVLSGDVNSRPFTAARLVRNGYCQKVLLTQAVPAWEVAEGIVPPEHEISTNIFQRMGIPPADVSVLPREVVITKDEAVAAKEFLDQYPESTLTVVTSFYHTRRSKWIFQQVFGADAHRVHLVSAPVAGVRYGDWWRDDEGVEWIVAEYLGLPFYALRYSGRWRIAATAAAVLLLLCVACVVFQRRRNRAAEQVHEGIADDQAARSRSGRSALRAWRYALLVGAVASVWWFRHPILVAVACGLIAEAEGDRADCLVLRSSSGLYTEGEFAHAAAAARFQRGEVQTIALLQRKWAEAAEVGAVPPFVELAERELGKWGVPQEAIIAMTAPADSRRAEIKAFGQWLAERPSQRVLLVCDRFASRMWRWVIDRELDAETAGRIGLLALPRRDFDETNWWYSYTGVKRLVLDYVRLAHAMAVKDA